MSKEFESKVLDFIDVTSKKFDNIDKKFDNIDKRFDKIDDKLDEHTKLLEEHSRQINSLQESVVLIEHKVTTEFPALFEAFELHQEMHKDYDEKNSYLSSKVEENSMRISVLEDQMKFIKTN